MITKRLPVKLTDDEIRLRGVEAAKLSRLIDSTEAEAKMTAKMFKEDIERLAKEHSRLTEQIWAGQEYREVQIEERKCWGDQKVETIRLDTREIIDVRPMTPQELARPLPMFGAEEGEDDRSVTVDDTTFTHKRKGRKAEADAA